MMANFPLKLELLLQSSVATCPAKVTLQKHAVPNCVDDTTLVIQDLSANDTCFRSGGAKIATLDMSQLAR